jgi:hypothetical protein
MEAPLGYFDQLADQIIRKNKRRRENSKIKQVVLILSIIIGVFILKPGTNKSDLDSKFENEHLLYIQSGVWTEEDILNIIISPNDILEEIIEYEWNYQTEEETEI